MARVKQRQANPISAAVETWVAEHGAEIAAETGLTDVNGLIIEAPRRWVQYEPMILLPSGSFTSAAWRNLLNKLSVGCTEDLWETMLRCIGHKSPGAATHLAVNDGIPLIVEARSRPEDGETEHTNEENILRSPIGLRILYGDFGPAEIAGSAVTDHDFGMAFWASTKQNGIYQTWAPRWTMFSRGNVKEKARLLGFHNDAPPASQAGKEEITSQQLHHRARPRAFLKDTWAVDLYAGIGYFVFSYAKLGMRVLCWELNPWSVEGLRRGAIANGWSVKVVQGEDLKRPAHEIVSEDDLIVVFLENNQEAASKIQDLRSQGFSLQVSHVNCGLLPRSDESWEAAREIMDAESDGWAHLHENVGVKDIQNRRGEIQSIFDSWDERNGSGRVAKVEHVELVKTFAPDVWHCVFDVYITKSNVETQSP